MEFKINETETETETSYGRNEVNLAASYSFSRVDHNSLSRKLRESFKTNRDCWGNSEISYRQFVYKQPTRVMKAKTNKVKECMRFAFAIDFTFAYLYISKCKTLSKRSCNIKQESSLKRRNDFVDSTEKRHKEYYNHE